MRKALFMNILVPLDGSKYSEKALLHACDMAKNYQSRLILLYVVEKTIPLNLLDRLEYLKMLRKVGNKVLIKGKNIATQHGVDSKIILKEGNITNEIIKLAKKEQCNLIVVGSKGLGATARFFLGSVSNKLANNSPCSILIVKY
ncbi:MAG: universal stress protein [Nitrosopumilus sp.]|nr:universal stress protein [Nitrosopumilus sp.]MDH3515912.1 universal stress protein [Nitrosopumilus sp.]MDH3564836.1 universal stress protein [Nitrosopumilus sp.]MDH5417230.1 universal stress protein [Nitrosopumilus sp.]MDH5554632.1 universal stress protein [Nitrosopumilus sp.]